MGSVVGFTGLELGRLLGVETPTAWSPNSEVSSTR